jgi:hypothetical protein
MLKIRACFSLLDCARAPVTVCSHAPAATRAKLPGTSPAARCSPKLCSILHALLHRLCAAPLWRPVYSPPPVCAPLLRASRSPRPAAVLSGDGAAAPPCSVSPGGPRPWRGLLRPLRVSRWTAAPPRSFSAPAPVCFRCSPSFPAVGEKSEEQGRWRPRSLTGKKENNRKGKAKC